MAGLAAKVSAEQPSTDISTNAFRGLEKTPYKYGMHKAFTMSFDIHLHLHLHLRTSTLAASFQLVIHIHRPYFDSDCRSFRSS